MGLLKQIMSRRSKRRLKKSAAKNSTTKTTAEASNSNPLDDWGNELPFGGRIHVLHESSKSTGESKQWMISQSSTDECGLGGGDTTSRNNGPNYSRQEAACSSFGWIWMFSCFDWTSLDHPLRKDVHDGEKEADDVVVDVQKRLGDRQSDDDETEASTPYDDETGGSSQHSESRVDQILKVPAALVDDVSDITSIPSSDDGESESESESDSDCDSSSSEEGEVTEAPNGSRRWEIGRRKKVDDSPMGYLIG